VITIRLGNASAFNRLKRALSGVSMRPVMQAIGEKIREITVSNFGTGGRWRPTTWPPYARDYPQWGKKKGGPATLIRTGALMDSIYVHTGNKNTVEVGFEGEYGAAHQFGGGNTPARPFFPIVPQRAGDLVLTPRAQAAVERVAAKEITRLLKNLV
jgi:phage gpG-like protein